MNNSDLAEQLAAAHGVTKTDAKKLVDAVFAAIGDAAAKGEDRAEGQRQSPVIVRSHLQLSPRN